MAAVILSGRGEHVEAAQRFEKLLGESSDRYGESALFGLSGAYFRLGDHRRVATSLRQFLKSYPQSEHSDEARLLLARSVVELKGPGDAEGALNALTSSPKVGDQAALFLARILTEAGRGDEAARLVTKALETFAESPLRSDLDLEFAQSLLAQNQFAEAAKHLQAFGSKYPTSQHRAHAHYLAAFALHRSDNPTKVARPVSLISRDVLGKSYARRRPSNWKPRTAI